MTGWLWHARCSAKAGGRASSKLPELVELVIAMPLVHAGTVTKTSGVTSQGARRIVLELGLRG
jgi:hypothetical protein